MLLQLATLAAAAATAPPFKTAVGLRPAARGLQDFAECPVLTKIKKDDCTDVRTARATSASSVCELRTRVAGADVRVGASGRILADDGVAGSHNRDRATAGMERGRRRVQGRGRARAAA